MYVFPVCTGLSGHQSGDGIQPFYDPSDPTWPHHFRPVTAGGQTPITISGMELLGTAAHDQILWCLNTTKLHAWKLSNNLNKRQGFGRDCTSYQKGLSSLC